MLNFFDGLNEAQRRAVTSTAPVILCLAGAGSGKTTVLTRRVANLNLNERIGISNMLCLTFTRLAGQEMKERIIKLVGAEGKNLFCNTFHAFCSSVLRDWGKKIGIDKNFTIYDQEDREAIIGGIIADLGGRTTIQKVLRLYENPLHDIKNVHSEEIRVIQEYAYRLRQNNAVDLDKLIEHTNHLLMTYPDVLSYYRKIYTHVFVDEFQDTSDDQMLLLNLLKPSNLFVVGDDFQAIYGWRKARVEYIINFPELHPNCEVIKLEDNYRSTHPIVQSANRLIAYNVNQTQKTLRAHKSGNDVVLHTCPDGASESAQIIKQVKCFIDSGLHYSDIAILTRTNSQISSIKGVMEGIGIPAILVSGDDDPFKKQDIKGIIAWMDIIVNPRDTIHLRRAMMFPREILSFMTLQRLQLDAMKRDLPIIDVLIEAPEAEEFRNTLVRITDRMAMESKFGAASELMRVLIDELGLRSRYESEGLTNRMNDANQAYNAILRWEESRCAMGDDWSASAFLKWFRYRDIQEKMIQENADAVRLMTVHASKGLEFPAVIIAGLTDGVFPSRMSADIEEERRLFYVALTRAKEHLILTYPEMTETWGGKEIPAEESRFIREALEA